MVKNALKIVPPLVCSIILIILRPWLIGFFSFSAGGEAVVEKITQILVLLSVAWAILVLVHSFDALLLSRFSMDREDNLKSRKVHTQIKLMEKVINFVVFLLTMGMILLSFDSLRQIGLGLFASAGLAGIVLGLSAQKVVGAFLAGIQIAITQPFRLDDAVVVEGEWGWIEEINLTYVVVRIWDKRRLILPSNYFLENPFQNWTRNNAELLGSVFLYVDYTVPLEELRRELRSIVEGTPLWDGKDCVLQVTDSTEKSMELRILVSARNSPAAWDLRVLVREKLIAFLQREYPGSLPRIRFQNTAPSAEGN